jgi:hypothetical protein
MWEATKDTFELISLIFWTLAFAGGAIALFAAAAAQLAGG